MERPDSWAQNPGSDPGQSHGLPVVGSRSAAARSAVAAVPILLTGASTNPVESGNHDGWEI
jgi:hypothetical protein